MKPGIRLTDKVRRRRLRLPSSFTIQSGNSLSVHLLISSLALLLITCAGFDPVQKLATILWLVSLALLGMANLGGALGVYIAALALHGRLRGRSISGLLEHPDNLALAIVVIGLLVAGLRRRARPINGPLAIVIALFLGYCLGSIVLFGSLTQEALFIFARLFLLPLLLFALTCSASLTRNDVVGFLVAIISVGIYTSIISLFERFEWHHLIFPTWIIDTDINDWIRTGRSGGLLMQPNWNGLLLNFTLGATLYGPRLGLLRLRIEQQHLLSILMTLAIFLTYTRAAWLCCLGVWVVYLWRPGSPAKSKRLGLKRAMLSAGMVGGVAIALLLPSRMAAQRATNEGTIRFRFELWSIAADMIQDKPLFGHGFYEYNDRVADYHRPGLQELSYRDLAVGRPSSHNMFLQVLVELGLLGFLLYLLVLCAMHRNAGRVAQQMWGSDGGWWITTTLGVYILSLQFAVASESTTNTLFFMLMGMIAGLGVKYQSDARPELGRRHMRGPDWLSAQHTRD